MDEQAEEPAPPPDADESAGAGKGGQAAGEGSVTNAVNTVGQQNASRTPDGKFLPGVLQPGAKPWPAGQSGNPGGRPLGVGRLTRRLVAALERDDGKLADALTNVILKRGLSGDFRFVQEIINRSEGRVAERLAGHDGGPLSLPAITVVKAYAGDRPAGEAGTEEQPPQPPETAQLPALPADPEPSAAGDALAAKIRLLRGAASDTESPPAEDGT